MNYDKIVAIDDNIVTISHVSHGSDKFSHISLQFYRLDFVETSLVMSGLPVTCNIAQRNVVVFCFAAVTESKTGLYRYFLLCGPGCFHGSVSTTVLWLYTVDNREMVLYVEFRLPANIRTYLSELTFEILDGPTVYFMAPSELYVLTSGGAVHIYPTGANGTFRHLTGWVEDCYLLVTGLSGGEQTETEIVSQPAMLTYCVNTVKNLFGASCDVLVPSVYLGMAS